LVDYLELRPLKSELVLNDSACEVFDKSIGIDENNKTVIDAWCVNQGL